MQYVDSSALLKRYVREPDSGTAARLLLADPEWVTAGHTMVEVRRSLTRRLVAAPEKLREARARFEHDWLGMYVLALDDHTCRIAADLAEVTGTRSLDALHLAAAQRAGAPALRFLTFDVRQAQSARALGWTVVGS